MSLQTATLGFGVVSKNNNLYINLPYIGTIYIGMDESELNYNIHRCSQMALKLGYDDKNHRRICYRDSNDNEVFSIMTIGNAVCRLRYNGLINLIPTTLIYQIGKKRFFTNCRVDKHMIAFKDDNEIFLKEVDSVDAVDITSESLGVVKRALTKAMAQKNSKAWMNVFETKDKYAPDVYKKDRSEVKALEQEYNELSQKEKLLESKKRKIIDIIDKRKTLDTIKGKEQEHQRAYDECKKLYAKLVNSNIDMIKDLVSKGKLTNDNGVIKLNRNSDETRTVERSKQVPVYRTVEETYEPEMLLHEDWDDYMERSKRERTTQSRRVFDGYRTEYYSEKIVDNDFINAKSIARTLESPLEDCENAHRVLDETKKKVAEAEKRLQEYMQTPEYKQGLREVDKINSELKQVKIRLNTLKKQLYG